MSKTKLFLVFTFSFIFLISPVFVFARDPIIIDSSILGPATGTGKDYDYHSNDILNTNTINCSGTFPITQTFNPIQIGIDKNSQPIFETQAINSIGSSLNIDENYTNNGIDMAYTHLVGTKKKIYGDTDTLNQSFLSLDTSNSYGTSGIADRSTTYQVLACQKAQRLIYAIESLDPEANLVYNNEQVGWNCSGQIYSVTEKKNGSGCTPIRLSDIAMALASDDIFYATSVDCGSSTLPDPVTLSAIINTGSLHPNPLSHDVATTLFDTAISVVASGSVASNVHVCDKDANNNPINCQDQQQSIPLGAVLATNQATVGQLVSSDQTVTHYDVCQTSSQTTIADKPNSLSFFAKIIKFFGEVTDTTKTFADSTTKTFNIDSRVNIDQDQAFLNSLIPSDDQVKYQTTDQSGSSTDGKAIHPGNSVARSVFVNELLPADF